MAEERRIVCESTTNNQGKRKNGKNKSKNTKEKKNSNASFGGTDRNKNGNSIAVANAQDNLPNIKALECQILEYIIGQDEAVRKVITAIYRARKFTSIKSNVLVIGNSGTGKTEIVSQVAERLNIPYTIEDATKYTQEGYYGADVIDMIYNLLENAKYDIKKAEKGIIVVDEIDKKSGSNQMDRDVSGVEVLNSLLKIIEGTKMKISDPFYKKIIDFNTRGITIIFLGAFDGLDKIREKRLNTNSMGFRNNDTKEKDIHKTKYLKQDLVLYGFTNEFVGRIDTIIEMNKLTKEDLELILRKSRLSIFKTYQRELRSKGVTISYPTELFGSIAEKALMLDTGARELKNVVNYIFENIIYEVLANPGKYKRCKMSLEIIEDNTKFELS